MRILAVWPAHRWATYDVARGYFGALERQGHELRHFRLYNRLQHHAVAFRGTGKKEMADNPSLLARVASESILAEAMWHRAELVLMVSGMSLHPDALWLLAQAKIPTAVILTESPYEDETQARFCELVGHVFTNDRTSAEKYGWTYLPHAVDPKIHRPVKPNPEMACDVLFLGTGWKERIQLFEAVDWTGIKLKIIGVLSGLAARSKLRPFYTKALIDNEKVPSVFRAAKIVLNFHRHADGAYSLGPRVREAAAIGAFLLTDWRPELSDTGLDRIMPTFTDARSLESLIRWYLGHARDRKAMAAQGPALVAHDTFDDRAVTLMQALTAPRKNKGGDDGETPRT